MMVTLADLLSGGDPVSVATTCRWRIASTDDSDDADRIQPDFLSMENKSLLEPVVLKKPTYHHSELTVCLTILLVAR